MEPTLNQQYTYNIDAPSGMHKIWRAAGIGLLAVTLVAGIGAGVVLTRQEAINQASAATSAGATIIIETGGTYTPDTIRIKKGQSVTWDNHDARRSRQVMPADDTTKGLAGFGTSEPLTKGQSYSYVFQDTGTFRYYDATGSQLIGTIIVAE